MDDINSVASDECLHLGPYIGKLVKKLITDKFIIKSDVQSTAVFEFQTGLSKILNTPDQMESFCKKDVW